MMKKAISLFLALVMLLSLCACGGKVNSDDSSWPTSDLGKLLPKPKTKNYEFEDDEWLDVKIYEVTADDFADYVAKCKKAGFTIDAYEDEDSYSAYNAEGYYLDVDFYEADSKIFVDLDRPDAYGDLIWPTAGLGALLPKPDSTKGKIDYSSSSSFDAYVGDITGEMFNAYVNQCMEKGFIVDYYLGDDYFNADNKDGLSLSVDLEDFNTMEIRLNAPDDYVLNIEEDETDTTTASENTEENLDSTSIRSDFKAAMDEYEAFIDEYVAFMIKYYESDGTDVTLMEEYVKFEERYIEIEETMMAWAAEDLSDAEWEYLCEVDERVTEKLAAV